MITKDQEEVQPRSGEPGFRLDEDELREFSRGQLAAYKTPKRILRKDNLERGPNGKANYKTMQVFSKEQLASRQELCHAVSSADPVCALNQADA